MHYLAAILANVLFVFALFAAHEYTERRKAKRQAEAEAMLTRAIEKAFLNRSRHHRKTTGQTISKNNCSL